MDNAGRKQTSNDLIQTGNAFVLSQVRYHLIHAEKLAPENTEARTWKMSDG